MKLIFIGIVLALFLMPSAHALQLRDNQFFTMQPDGIECIDIVLPDVMGVFGMGKIEYELSSTADRSWADIHHNDICWFAIQKRRNGLLKVILAPCAEVCINPHYSSHRRYGKACAAAFRRIMLGFAPRTGGISHHGIRTRRTSRAKAIVRGIHLSWRAQGTTDAPNI